MRPPTSLSEPHSNICQAVHLELGTGNMGTEFIPSLREAVTDE